MKRALKVISGAALMVAMSIIGACGGGGSSAPVAAAPAPVTVTYDFYVDAATGVDTNTGTAAVADPAVANSGAVKTISKGLALAAAMVTANAALVPPVTAMVNVKVAPGTYSAGETFPIMMPDKVGIYGDLANKGVGTTINGKGAYTIPASCTSIGGFAGTWILIIPENVTATVSGLDLKSTGNESVGIFGALLATIDSDTITANGDVGIQACSPTASPLTLNIANSVVSGSTAATGGNAALYVGDIKSVVSARNTTFTGNNAILAGNGWGLPVLDLGTSASPGGNTIIGGATGVGLNVQGGIGGVNAAHNIWKKNVQGSDPVTGGYAAQIIPGPVAVVGGNNYSLATATLSVQF